MCSSFEPAEVAALVDVFLCILIRIHEGIRSTDGESLREGFSPPLSSLSFLVMQSWRLPGIKAIFPVLPCRLAVALASVPSLSPLSFLLVGV